MTKGHFEAKLHAYRRTQSGAVVSFVIHPDDIAKLGRLTIAPLGTHLMIGWSEIAEDGKPVGEPQNASSAKAEKPKRNWAELKPSAQAALRCDDEDFQEWIGAGDKEEAAELVRKKCTVASRSEFDSNPLAAKRWKTLSDDFLAFQTTMRYEGVRR